MALNSYLSLTGETQGVIVGSVTQAGREGTIMTIATSHEVISPRDAASGLPTGKRQHAPFVITKEVDQASPALYNRSSTTNDSRASGSNSTSRQRPGRKCSTTVSR